VIALSNREVAYAQSLIDYISAWVFGVENFRATGRLERCVDAKLRGCIRVFPNTNNLGPARLRTRAVGAFS